jgi:hypothetical protein
VLTLPINQEFYVALDDEDWFTFTLESERVVMFTHSVTNSLVHNSFYWPNTTLYDSNGQRVAFLYFNQDAPTARLLPSGRYYIKVAQSQNGFEKYPFIYTLSLTTEALPDVNFEPNNTLAQATPITLGFTDTFFVLPQDKDYFKFTLEQTTQVSLAVSMLSMGGIRIDVLNSSGNTEYNLFNGNKDIILSAGLHYLVINESDHVKYQL